MTFHNIICGYHNLYHPVDMQHRASNNNSLILPSNFSIAIKSKMKSKSWYNSRFHTTSTLERLLLIMPIFHLGKREEHSALKL
jgi:hypothetical protein